MESAPCWLVHNRSCERCVSVGWIAFEYCHNTIPFRLLRFYCNQYWVAASIIGADAVSCKPSPKSLAKISSSQSYWRDVSVFLVVFSVLMVWAPLGSDKLSRNIAS